MSKSVYRDIVIGQGKVRYLHWWNRWYWKRHATKLPEWDGELGSFRGFRFAETPAPQDGFQGLAMQRIMREWMEMYEDDDA